MRRAAATTGEARARLVEEIAKRARIETARVAPDAHLLSDLGLSSLDALSVLAFAEEQFGVRFPDQQLASLTTLRSIEDAVARQRRHGSDESGP